MKAELQELKEVAVQLNQTPDKQISLTDPDARSMKTRAPSAVERYLRNTVQALDHLAANAS